MEILYIQKTYVDSRYCRHVQGNRDVLQSLTELFHANFGRSRTTFLDWSTGPDYDTDANEAVIDASTSLKTPSNPEPSNSKVAVPAGQTAFWKPVLDPSSRMVRIAFGMEYMVSNTTSVKATKRLPRKRIQHTTSDLEEDGPRTPESLCQRLSVYLQLKRDSEDESENLAASGGAGDGTKKGLSERNTMIVYDSMNSEVVTDQLVVGREPWQELANGGTLAGPRSKSDAFAVATMLLLFDAVAGKWADDIFRMEDFVSALAEDIYDDPANDEPASILWTVSKEVLKAERLLKSHLHLLETIQGDLRHAIDSVRSCCADQTR